MRLTCPNRSSECAFDNLLILVRDQELKWLDNELVLLETAAPRGKQGPGARP